MSRALGFRCEQEMGHRGVSTGPLIAQVLAIRESDGPSGAALLGPPSSYVKGIPQQDTLRPRETSEAAHGPRTAELGRRGVTECGVLSKGLSGLLLLAQSKPVDPRY